MPDAICLGELLIDFCSTKADVSLAEAPAFAKAPGGAPANVAVGLKRMGVSSGFLGAVGDDPFGRFLADILRREGVDVSRMPFIPGVRTTLAFVAVRSDGKQDFTFYRHPGADMRLAPEHVDEQYLGAARALHYGSISRIDESPRAATDKACRIARERGLLVSYDPNLRRALWPDDDLAREQIRRGFEGATVAKVSEEEWEFITGTTDLAGGAKGMFDAGVRLVVRSEGARGASFVTRRAGGHVDGFQVEPVEFTGAGDAFVACLVCRLLEPWSRGVKPDELDEATLRRFVRDANAVGALTTTKPGAIPAIPTAEEARAFLART